MEVLPVAIASVLASLWRGRTCWISFEPFFYFVGVKLFAPQHARERLALHAALVFGHVWRAELRPVEAIGFRLAQGENLFRVVRRQLRILSRQSKHYGLCLAGLNLQSVVSRCLGARTIRVDGFRAAVDHDVVDAVFDVRRAVGNTPKPLGI